MVQLPVSDTLSNTIHQMMMVDVVEASFDITFDNPLVWHRMPLAIFCLYSWPHRHADMLQSPMTSSAGSESV